MAETKLNIICYKWGDYYTSEEANILYAMVKRNLTLPFDFYCITDNKTGLRKEINAIDMPYLDLPGNGPKIWTFSKGFLGLKKGSLVVSLDIDLVIVGSLDFLADNPDEPFIVTKHTATKANVRGHGAVYRVKVGHNNKVWDEFIADPQKAAERYPGLNGNDFSEQEWLEYHFAGKELSYFPNNKIILFRSHTNARSISHVLGRSAGAMGLTLARFGSAKLPNQGEAIVSFAGKVNPRDVLNSHCGHLKQAPFVAKHWRL